jgi:hypothetical protein
MKSQPGTTIISGQVSHSLKISLGFLHLARDDADIEIGPYGANHVARTQGTAGTIAQIAAARHRLAAAAA